MSTLPAQTLQDHFNRTGPDLGISSSAVPYSSFDVIGSSNQLKVLTNQLGATHPGESAVLTLDRGPDASLGAVVAVLPDVGSRITLIVRQKPTASYGYGGYMLIVDRTDVSTYVWQIARRDPQQLPVTLGATVTGSALEVGGWLGIQATGSTITGWYVAAANVTADGTSVSFNVANAVNVIERTDATYTDAGTYVVILDDTSCRLDTLTGSGTVVYPDPPANTDLPRIVGTAHTGETLTCNPGTWINGPDSYAYQWRRNGSSIVGATTSTFVLSEDDENRAVTCRVTATNAGGAGTADTAAITPTRPTFGQSWGHDGTDWVPLEARTA